VAENQPANKNRMTTELSHFAEQLRSAIQGRDAVLRRPVGVARQPYLEPEFDSLALELFALQFKHNAAYRKICEARGLTPKVVEHWMRIPAVPTSVFKELELTGLTPGERTTIFNSSGTTGQKPSRHFHNAESLAVYEVSLWQGFQANVVIGAPNSDSACFQSDIVLADSEIGAPSARQFQLIILTPPPALAPHSSLVHMFETVRRKLGAAETALVGKLAADGSWTLNFDATLAALNLSLVTRHPSLLLGTAFSFVHLLDFMAENNLRFDLPAGSRVMETGGYKNRSRSMPKTELHQLITERLGVPPSHIICEYGMSELSSQAYDTDLERRSPTRRDAVGVQALACSDGTLKRELQHAGSETGAPPDVRHFHFPRWARVQIISPETGREVADGETGLIRVFDLANVFSVMAIQTEDLGVRRENGFELIGRVQLAEPRGCSLMAV
jgi:hypothetical protein